MGAALLPLFLENTQTTKTVVWVVMIVAGAINGFGASILWIGQGKYVSDCSDETNKGFHYGLVWSILAGSQLIGHIIAAFLIDTFSQTVFFKVMSVMSFLGFMMFFTLTKPVKDNNLDFKQIKSDKLLA